MPRAARKPAATPAKRTTKKIPPKPAPRKTAKKIPPKPAPKAQVAKPAPDGAQAIPEPEAAPLLPIWAANGDPSVAQVLGLSRAGVYKLLQEKRFPVETLKVGRRVMVRTVELREYVGLNPDPARFV